MLRQVIHNLLQNAQDALVGNPIVNNLGAVKPNATIKVITKIEGTMLVLQVQDNGTGFPAAMLLHAFEPYMTTKPHGTGLGLAIVKKIIEEHKGSIRIENIGSEHSKAANAETTGALVTISIPLFGKMMSKNKQ